MIGFYSIGCVVNMILILAITILTLTDALEPKQETSESDIKKIIGKYVDKIPDVDSQFIINEGLSKAIKHYFNGKLNTFPLYKISLKIDRNPIKIPWTLGNPNQTENAKKTKYKYVKPVKSTLKIKEI